MPNVSCLWTPIFFWMRELKLEKKMCTKVTMLNDFRSRWNGDVWLFFSDKVMFFCIDIFCHLFTCRICILNIVVCFLVWMTDMHYWLLCVITIKLWLLYLPATFRYIILQCFTCTGTYCVAVTLKSVSCVLDTILNHVLYLLFWKIPLLPLLHCMFLTFLLRLITRIGSKCYGLINLIHVLSFSDMSFRYCIVISVWFL